MRSKAAGLRARHVLWAALALGLSALPLRAETAAAEQTQDPLTAIDWLALPEPEPLNENTASETANSGVPPVDVTPLDPASPAGVGLLPGAAYDLPSDLWDASTGASLARLIDALPQQAAVPSLQQFSSQLLLAEAAPPRSDSTAFLAARLDALIRRGALAPAREMIALLPDPRPAPILARQADIALLEGDTGPVCAAILRQPIADIALDLRVFCTARAGAWGQAMTLLEAGYALGDITSGTRHRLLRFLDPGLAELLPELPPPSAADLTPLDYRILVATGVPLPTATLPLPFAVAEVSGDAGWKPRIEAAERLVRAGAMSPRQLFEAYTHRRPAASGGVWDRVAAYQALETALQSEGSERLGQALLDAWPLFLDHGLAVPLAEQIGPALRGRFLTGNAEEVAQDILLLSGGTPSPEAPPSFEARLMRGLPSAPPDAQARAITAAWDFRTPPPAPAQGTRGAALLDAVLSFDAGADGNLPALTDALRQLRALGFEDVAREAALQLRLARPPA